MITPDLAYRIRFERGLALSPNAEFSIPRLKEIAVEWDLLWKKIKSLDNEIEKIYIKDEEQ
jgi:hypothetical protein